MNGFNKTEAAVFSCRLCFLRAFPFISLIKLLLNVIHTPTNVLDKAGTRIRWVLHIAKLG